MEACRCTLGRASVIPTRSARPHHAVPSAARTGPQAHSVQGPTCVTFPPGGRLGPPKSDAGYRDVSIPPTSGQSSKITSKKWVWPGQNMLLFPGEARGHMWHSAMGRHFAKAKNVAGREDLKWHDLRHTGATMAKSAQLQLSSKPAMATRRRLLPSSISTPRTIVIVRLPNGCLI